MDYFVWALVSPERTIVVDTGFDRSGAEARKRELLRPVEEGLAAIGVDHRIVRDVVFTHLHYDHCGNRHLFPEARFHVQDSEMQFATGRCMCHETFRTHYEMEDVLTMVRRTFTGRTEFHSGATELAPGVTLHHVGGHTLGMQVVRVKTQRGFVVLASDVSHYYENIEKDRAFPAVYSIGALLDAYRDVRRLASSGSHVIPGHDPLVLRTYPPSAPSLVGLAARLDLDPIQPFPAATE